MKNNKLTSFATQFEEDVWKGLNSFPKYLPSKYIYDKKGDKLFQRIMAMPEYYLTDCEFNILDRHQKTIAESFKGENGFDLIELGAGDGKKTKILLRYLSDHQIDFKFLPIDISPNILKDLKDSLRNELPKVKVNPLQGSYFSVLEEIANYNDRKKVILVLGSNIGNLHQDEAIEFLKNIREAMRVGDLLFMGFDQKKNPQTIFDAYNDQAGITEAFNKNMLVRINSELGGDFDLEGFLHWETYDPETGTATSYLVSKFSQKVEIAHLNLKVEFEPWESIHTEISQKYDDTMVYRLAEQAGLQTVKYFSDDKGYYKNYIFEKEEKN